MRIWSLFADADTREFDRLKRRSAGEWKLVSAGEWSESPYHEGKTTFHIRSSPDRLFWALRSSGFPHRIVAVAEMDTPIEVERAAAYMMDVCRAEGGPYIEFVHRNGELRADLLWDTYEQLTEERRRSAEEDARDASGVQT